VSETAHHKLQTFVNSSGFPLQIGLSQLLAVTYHQNRKWCIQAAEHPWENPISKSSGFVDLMIQNQYKTEAFVVECKRVQNAEWTFLCPSPNPNQRSQVNCWLTEINGNKTVGFDWVDLNSAPSSFQSEFCVVPGQDTKSKPMLERTAADLIEATEAIASEEYELHKNNQSLFKVYFPLIVTTAKLNICKFDPNKINIKNGEIVDAEFERVPFLRFRKSLTARNGQNKNYQCLTEASKAKERTTFIVNSEHLIDFLSDWELGDLPRNIKFR